MAGDGANPEKIRGNFVGRLLMARKPAGAKAPVPASLNGQLALLRHLATSTANPLYVWEAIELCTAIGTALPDWCLNYVQATAILIRDIRNRHFDAEAFRSDLVTYRKTRTDYPAKDAISAVPGALQLEHKGWNAFTEYERAEKKIHDAATYEAGTELPEIGVEDAIERIKQRNSINETRSVIRRVRQGQSLSSRSNKTKPKGD